MARHVSEDGFTLVEVLVAMAVLSLAILALLRLGGAHLDTAVKLEQATLASIAAENVLAETLVSDSVPGFGQSRMDVEVGGRSYEILQTVERSAVDGVIFVRIDAAGPEGEHASVEGLRGS